MVAAPRLDRRKQLDIAGVMQDADDPQAVLILEIEDHIAINREAAQTRDQFVAPATGAGLAAQVLEFRIDQVDEGVCLGGVVGVDELPDLG